MSRNYRVEAKKSPFGRVVFPVDYYLALYVRQSSGEQVENNPESFLQQTQELYKIAKGDLAWPGENILPPFIENRQASDGSWKDASGTLRLDQRPALQALVGYIERDEVKAVLVWLVDRLFRDEDGAEAPAFARICKTHNCLVLTSQGDIFDFTNQRDYKRFLREADVASEFITDYLKGRAHPARKAVALRGEYDGRAVTIGFFVEQKTVRKRFEQSIPRRYQVWEPHASVVRWLFRRYRELAGNFAALKREVAQKTAEQGYLFPSFPNTMHRPHIKLRHNGRGYVISDRGLQDLLCNVAYIGWYYNKGGNTIKDNHPAIVDEGDFWYAFDRLSPVTVDGELKTRPATHFTKVGTDPVPALLYNVLTADGPYKVYVNQNAGGKGGAAYAIIDNKEYYGGDKLGSIAVTDLDSIVTSHLLAKLEEGKKVRDYYAEMPHFADALNELENKLVLRFLDVAKMQGSLTAGIDAQIAEYTQEAESLDRTLHFGAKALDGKTIEQYAGRLAKLRRSLDQLETKRTRLHKEQAELQEFTDRLGDVPATWEKWSVEKRRRFIELATEKITLKRVARNWLQLEIAWFWPDEPHSLCYIWQRKTSDAWTAEENTLLCTLYPTADRAILLTALPDRSWTAIQHQAYRLHIFRPWDVRAVNSSGLHKYLSLEDQAFMESVGIVFDTEHADVHAWWSTSHTSEDSQKLNPFDNRTVGHTSTLTHGLEAVAATTPLQFV